MSDARSVFLKKGPNLIIERRPGLIDRRCLIAMVVNREGNEKVGCTYLGEMVEANNVNESVPRAAIPDQSKCKASNYRWRKLTNVTVFRRLVQREACLRFLPLRSFFSPSNTL